MIRIEALGKRYGATTVVDAVTMENEAHTITTIVGTSGSGNSTLLRMINRLVDAHLDAEDLHAADTLLSSGFANTGELPYPGVARWAADAASIRN